MHHTKDWYLERLVPIVVGASEFAGVQVAIFPQSNLFFIPLPPIPPAISLFFVLLWCIVQSIISTLLLVHVWDGFKSLTARYGRLYAMRESFRFLNMTIICIIMQGYGVLYSFQLFGAAVALTDGLFLYQISEFD